MNLVLSLAEGARFENPEASGTIVPNSLHRLILNHLTEQLGVEKEPIKPDRPR